MRKFIKNYQTALLLYNKSIEQNLYQTGVIKLQKDVTEDDDDSSHHNAT